MSKKEATDILEVPKSLAIALCTKFLGYKTSKKWSCEKLAEKLNEIEQAPDEPLEDSDLDELIDLLMEVEEAIVVEDEEEPEEDVDESDDISDDEIEDDEEAEDDEEEDEEEKPKKKKGKSKKAPKEHKGKERKMKISESINSVTIDLLKRKPMSLKTLVSALSKRFPDHDPETLERTTKRRLSCLLKVHYGVEVKKSPKGIYSIEE